MFNLTEKSKDFLLNIVNLFTNDNDTDTDAALNHSARNMVMNGTMRITPIKQMQVSA